VAESAARKELELRMKVVPDTSQGSRAVQELTKQAERLEQSAGKAQKALAGVFGFNPAAGSAGAAGAAAGPGTGAMAAGPGSPQALMATIQQLNRTMAETLRFDKEQAAKEQQTAQQRREEADVRRKEAERKKLEREPGVLGGLAQAGVFGGGADMAATAMGVGNLGGLARVAAGVGLGYQAMRTGAAAGNIQQDPFMSQEQKNRALFRQLPFGETIQGFGDAITGRPAAFARQELRHQEAMTSIQAGFGTMDWRRQQNIRQAELDERARQFQTPVGRPILEGDRISDKTIREGGPAMRDMQRRVEGERQQQRAFVETQAATAAREQAEREFKRTQDETKEAEEHKKKLEKDVPEKGPERQRRLDQIKEQESRIQGLGEQAKGAAQTAAEAKAREEQARAKEKLVGASRARVEADVLEEKAATSAAGAQKLGAMNPFERANALENLKLLQAHGPEALSPQQVASAQALAPQTVGKLLEKHGTQTPEFKELQKAAPDDFAGDPGDLRKRAQEERDKAAKAELDAEGDIAKSAAEEGKKLGRRVADAITQVVAAAIRQLELDLRRGKGAKE
jgi:hypothetical protein